MEKGNRLLIGGTHFGSAAIDPEDTSDRERPMRPPLDPGDLAARSAFGARRRKVIAQLLHMRLADVGVGFTSDFQLIAASTRPLMIAKASARPAICFVASSDCDLGHKARSQFCDLW